MSLIRTPSATVAFVLVSLGICISPGAQADYQQRLSLGVGVVTLGSPSQTDFELGAEYEYRAHPLLGLGIAGNYVFSSPSITLVAVPDLFLHPLAGDWVVSAAPLFEFTSGSTNVGARLGTRIPVPLGVATLFPSFAVDFINGTHDYWYGLGLQF